MIPQLMIYAGFALAAVHALGVAYNFWMYLREVEVNGQDRYWRGMVDNLWNGLLCFAGTMGFRYIMKII